VDDHHHHHHSDDDDGSGDYDGDPNCFATALS
jgi:hypothetical protein